MWVFICIVPSSVKVKSSVEYRPGKPSKQLFLGLRTFKEYEPRKATNLERKKTVSLLSLPPVEIQLLVL